MNKKTYRTQRGYINLDGLTAVLTILSVFGVLGLVALFGWVLPAAWEWVKPWMHAVTV